MIPAEPVDRCPGVSRGTLLAYTAPTGMPGQPSRAVRARPPQSPASTDQSDQLGGPRMTYRNDILLNEKSLKLGLFGPNCSSGRSYITAPERWVTSWENNVKLAQMADDIGLECMV